MPAYDNNAVAAKLSLYADLLEISGADKYRFLSYKKAANSIRSWPEQVSVLARESRLNEIPGVGAKLGGIVSSIVDTGTFEEFERVLESVPASLAQVMAIPGVGPKRAALLHSKLGISNVDELSSALADGRVERLGGFGAKTAEKMAAALAAYRERSGRRPLAESLPTAQQLVGEISRVEGVLRAEVAGSIRRRAETTANIDIVVSSRERELVASAITRLPAVERVLDQQDGDQVSVELHDGMRLDVRIVDPEHFGAALRYFTGSREHNAAVELLAAMRGIEIDGHLVYRDGAPIDVPDEDEAFRLLALPVMAPETREGNATLAAAAQGNLPRLIELSDIKGDLQTHSTYTDGRATLIANRDVAAELGYAYIAATDHAYGLRMVGGLDLEDLERQWAEIDRLNEDAEGKPLILKGIELNVGEDGSLDYDDETLARFDIVLASLHTGWDQDEERVTERMLTAIRHPLVDIIAHPTGRIIGRRGPMMLDMAAVLGAAGETGTIMEINSYPDRLDLSAEHIQLARSFGVRFSLGTDAHAANHLRFMPYGVAQARRGLVACEEMLNCQPWEVARTWLKRSRRTAS